MPADGVTDLAAVWPEVARRLAGYLRTRTAPSEVDDLVQQVAERALVVGPAYDSADDLLRWCIVVARNLDVDRHRRSRRFEPLGPDLDVASDTAYSTEDAVLVRLRLARALEGLRQLSPRDRDLIVADVERSTPQSGRDRVAKHRARGRLLKLVGPAALLAALGRLRAGTRPLVQAGGVSLAASAVLVVSLSVQHEQVQQVELHPAPSVAVTPAPATKAAPARPRPAPRTTALTARPRSSAVRARAAAVQQEPTVQQVPVTVTGHRRRAQDSGAVCVRDLPLVQVRCLGPAGS